MSEAGAGTAQIVDLATKLGVTQGAVTTFLRTLGEKDVPVEELPAKLGEIAERHKALLAQIASVRSDSPDVQAIKDQAHAAVERGDYERAESLLTKAEDAALASADQLRLDAAALRAERGELAFTRLDYRAAAGHFATAASLVPAAEPLVRAGYLNREGQAADEGGSLLRGWSCLDGGAPIARGPARARRPGPWREPQQPGRAVPGTPAATPRPSRCSSGRSRSSRRPWGRIIRTSPPSSTTWPRCTGTPAATPRPSRCSSGRSRSTRRPWGRIIRASPPTSTTWPGCTRTPAATPRPSRCTSGRLRSTRRRLGPDHPDVASGLNNLAALYRATGPLRRGRAAVPAGDRDRREGAWGRIIRTSPPTSTTWPGCTTPPAATPRPSRCTSGRSRSTRRPWGRIIRGLATDLNNLAALYRDTGRYAEAEPLYQRAIAIDEKALGPDHPGLATDLNNLAALYQATGRYAEAEPLFQRAIAIDEKALGPDHPDSPEHDSLADANPRRRGRAAVPAGAGHLRGAARSRPPDHEVASISRS